MESPILVYKNELIEWIKNIDDLEVLSRLIELKDNENKDFKISDPKIEYQVKDDFEERFSRGIQHNEMKRRTFEYIKSLPWKK